MSTITVLSPEYETVTTSVSMAPRRRPAEGEEWTITLIDNGKSNAKTILTMLADRLTERLPITRVDIHSKPAAGKPIDRDTAEMFAARSHLVISGVGD
ncbi:MAG: hypothetical protein RIE08_04275 [Acidimicrobiales bacterium]